MADFNCGPPVLEATALPATTTAQIKISPNDFEQFYCYCSGPYYEPIIAIK